ncbi:hypothetical protein FJT64_000452 [Amphibalanus amphitrite]|uniref:Uncharacterized protein n=1 Tax=Amphibalanus amphitrite TaxID=1232801 RepID=A0A6A4VXR0_AMPAM|nr:hypothetical protein FJT64_000452 [Amphibalanus amphitrite]
MEWLTCTFSRSAEFLRSTEDRPLLIGSARPATPRPSWPAAVDRGVICRPDAGAAWWSDRDSDSAEDEAASAADGIGDRVELRTPPPRPTPGWKRALTTGS